MNGTSPLVGRLEVKYDGVFGPVCDDSFDLNAADVVCRQLGFFRAATVMFGSPFGKADGFILDDVVCSGTEDNLAKCAHDAWLSHNCEEDETVGIECIAGMLDLVIRLEKKELRITSIFSIFCHRYIPVSF